MDQSWRGARIEKLLRQVETLLHAEREGAALPAERTTAPPIPALKDETALLQRATRLLALRRKRESTFCNDIFGEPAWDILLDLFRARLRNETVCISSACIAASVPQTTALRWVQVLCEKNYVSRRPDPDDARRSLLTLNDEGFEQMKALLAQF